MPRDHRKLDAFKLADELAVMIYQATTDFPPSERYGLQSQIRRAAVSTPTNIVEGCARESEADCRRFLDIAFGSSRELLYLVSVAARLGFLNAKSAEEATTLGDRVAGALTNLRRALRS
jgi:four helix bundle protein